MKVLIRSFLILSMTLTVVFFLISPLYANVIQVTNSNDSGTGSFREAIITAEGTQEADTIVFAPGLVDETLSLSTELPNLPSNLTLDGTNAPFIDGSYLDRSGGYPYVGLSIRDQTNITISGFRLAGFEISINIWGAVSNITIEDNTMTRLESYEYSTNLTYQLHFGNGGNNIRFINNTVTNGLLVIYSLASTSIIRDVEVSGNTLIGEMAGISITISAEDDARIENVLIADNSLQQGAGVSFWMGPGYDNHISNITIRHNTLENSGAGISGGMWEGSNSSITGLIIEHNKMEGSPNGGVTLRVDNSDNNSLIDAIVRNNIMLQPRTGINCEGRVTADIRNNYIRWAREGMMLRDGCSANVVNNMIHNSRVGLRLGQSEEGINLINNMIVDNCLSGIEPEDEFIPIPSSTLLSHNNVWGHITDYKGISPGANDISVDPLFVNPDSGDFHLSDSSPAIDAGSPDPAYYDGWLGKATERADIGLYGGPGAAEFDFVTTSTVPVIAPPLIGRAFTDTMVLSDSLRDQFGGSYAFILTARASPCRVSWIKAISPSGQEFELYDDGSNGDDWANDGAYMTLMISQGHPEPGPWTFRSMSLQGDFFEKQVNVNVNTLPLPVLAYPANGQTIPSLTTALWWSAVPGGVDKYSIGIFDGQPEKFSPDGIIFNIEVDGQTTSVPVPDGVLEPGKTYYWFVQPRVFDFDGQEINSYHYNSSIEMWHFTTPSWVVADFTAEPRSGGFPLEVTFTDTSKGPVDSWSWDFGNGQTSTEQNPTTTFYNEGRYDVTLTVTGGLETDEEIKTAYIDAHQILAEIVDPPAGIVNTTQYTLHVGGEDVTAYQYRLDSGFWSGEIPINTPIEFNIPDEGAHVLYVRGKDPSGIWQSEADVTTANWTIDTLAPTVEIDNPLDGFLGDQINTLEATATDDNAIVSVQFQVTDGVWFVEVNETSGLATLVTSETWITGNTSGNDTWYVSSNNFPWTYGKNYTILALATDNASNTSFASVRVTYHNLSTDPAWTTLFMDLSTQTIIQNDTLEASGKLTRLPPGDPPVSLLGLPIVMTITAPDQSQLPQITTNTYTDEGHYQFTDQTVSLPNFTQSGAYTLKTSFQGGSGLYPSESESKLVLVGKQAGYAIIVQGKIPIEEGLKAHDKTTTRIYKRLKDRGFMDDNIYFFNYNYDPLSPPDGVDALPDKSEIRSAIETWAANKMNATPAPLYIIMVDHGNRDAFYIDDSTISPVELSSWLNTLEGRLDTAASAEKRLVIIGACYSGSFIHDLSANTENRIIIASAAGDEESFKGPLEPDGIRSGEFFLEEFFLRLWRGDSIREAFQYASIQTRIYTRKGGKVPNTANPYFDGAVQHPLLDDNGDGYGSNVLSMGVGDGRVSKDIYLGVGLNYETNSAANPAEIVQVTEALYLNASTSSAVLWARAYDDNEVGSAWIEVRPPSMVITSTGGTEQPEVNLDQDFMQLNPTTSPQRWENDKYLFSQSGKYEIYYFVKDSETGEISPMRRSLVYKNSAGNNNPGSFGLLSPINMGDTDYEDQKTMLLFDWEDANDPDAGDLVTYNLIISTDASFDEGNIVFRREEIPISITYLEVSDGLKDLTTYHWKVEAVDSFGGKTTCDAAWSFKTNNTNAFPGFIKGMVFNGINFSPISGVNVSASLGATATSLQDGNYLMIVPAGITSLSAESGGFENASLSDIRVPEGSVIDVNIMMLPVGGNLDTFAPISSASPPGGSYAQVQSVTFTCNDPGGAGCDGIYYTVDGSEPTSSSSVYASPIPIGPDSMLKFFAKDHAGNSEPVHIEVYSISLLKGNLNGDSTIDIADAILGMQMLSRNNLVSPIYKQADVNGDNIIGLEDIIFIFQIVSEFR